MKESTAKNRTNQTKRYLTPAKPVNSPDTEKLDALQRRSKISSNACECCQSRQRIESVVQRIAADVCTLQMQIDQIKRVQEQTIRRTERLRDEIDEMNRHTKQFFTVLADGFSSMADSFKAMAEGFDDMADRFKQAGETLNPPHNRNRYRMGEVYDIDDLEEVKYGDRALVVRM